MKTRLNKARRSFYTLAALCTAAGQIAIADNSTSMDRVVGGDPINITQAPGTVALLQRARVEQDGDLLNAQVCGGTLIAPGWVVTAAHCVFRNGNVVSPNALMVLIGTTDLTQPTTQPVNVTQVIVHEEYQSDATWQRDIALVGLEFSSTTTPVALDGMTQTLNDEVYTAGWGATVEGLNGEPNQFPTQLQGAALRLIPGSECSTIFPQFAGAVDGTHACAAVNNGGRGSCFGDSGGPLFRITPDSRVGSLIGIVSGGFRCGETGVYTNAISYADWIQSKIGPVSITTDGAEPPVSEPPVSEPPVSEPPVNDPPTTTPANDTGSGSSSDSGSGSWVLLLIGIAALFRKYRI